MQQEQFTFTVLGRVVTRYPVERILHVVHEIVVDLDSFGVIDPLKVISVSMFSSRKQQEVVI